ncbi:MAG: diacylglycerol/lipid kinase family protein [Candidatus Acidiferrales bacterium]
MNDATLVIVNPGAGGGRALRAEPRVADFLSTHGHPAEFLHCKNSKDAEDQARRAAQEGYRCVAALGGDGVFHHVVEGILGTSAVAGFFPAGNGNDIARSLGIPCDALKAAKSFLQFEPRTVDLIRARFADGRTAHFIGAGGVGLDAEAAHQANTRFRKWPGLARYLAGAFWTFRREPAFALEAQLDGVSWEGRAIIAVAANGAMYGAGLRIAPDAQMDDGRMDILLAKEIGWGKLIASLMILLRSGRVRFKEIERFRVRSAKFRADRALKVHGDGELLGESPVEFEILPGAVRVMAPRRD